ncbi:MAG: xylulose kinase [Clostridiales bacterium]|nr:xylulose kinase [Clostridiales bacterium]
MALIGLDIGTTGAKATIFDEQGRILSYEYGEYDVTTNEHGHFELDPRVVWRTVKGIIKKANKKAGNINIKALCTSSFGEAYVMLDKAGAELGNTPIYMDKRGEKECEDLVGIVGAMEIMNITGHPPHPMYSISKLMWQHKNNPAIIERTAKILFYGDYILHKLGGQYIADYSLAARTMCFDIGSKEWSKNIIEAAGLDPRIFPETKATGTVVGEITPSLADELGINKGIKLVLGGHDQIMAAVGAGVTEPGRAVNGIGTVDCITPVFKGTRINNSMLKSSYASVPFLFEDIYVTYAFNMTGGSLLKWFRDTFASKDKEIAERDNLKIYHILDNEMPKDPTDLFVLPHFVGSSTPNPDIHAKGAIINLTLGTERGTIYKACMEGETFEMKHNIEVLEANDISIGELRTVGGGSRSPQWLQIRADILGKKIAAMEFEEAGTLGTAILAGVAAGSYDSISEAASALSKIKNYYYPDGKRREYYNERYEKYKLLYNLLKAVR